MGRKAVAFPSRSTVYLERSFWDAVPTIEGRKAILYHEIGHLSGAECEACADFLAGWYLREDGTPTARDARRALRASLDNRDPLAAEGNLARGFGVDDVPDALAGLARRTDEGWRGGKSLGPILLVEARPGVWLSEATARAYLGLLADPSAAAVLPTSVESSFRTYAKQATLRELYEKGKGNPASRPGFSNHQQGDALDLAFASTAARETFAGIAEKHGFKRDAPGETWHFHYVGGPARATLVVGLGTAAVLLAAAGAFS